jgi:ribosomal protein L37E
MASLAAYLSETARMWRHAVAPTAEWIARTLWTRKPKQQLPPTRLTQRHKREVWGTPAFLKADLETKPEMVCRDCGKALTNPRSQKCSDCYLADASTQMLDVARLVFIKAKDQPGPYMVQTQPFSKWVAWESIPSFATPEIYARECRRCLALGQVRPG